MLRWLLVSCFIIASSVALAQGQGTETILGRNVATSSDMVSIMRGFSPRAQGIWHQYQYLQTPLRGNVVISDMLHPSDAWYDAFGRPAARFDVTKQTPENYANSHNHYQNLLSEVISFTPGANAVAVWGDSAAVVNSASAWGGFLSARSSCKQDDRFDPFNTDKMDRGCGPDFDVQLTGLEVDVLNGGKPGVFPNKAKHGVQVVGFGNPNGQAFSVIVENFDRELEFQRGHFGSILYAENSLHPEYGRFVVADFDKASIGLDFRKPIFTDGAMQFRSEGVGTGIRVNNGSSGEIYGGLRWPKNPEMSNWLTVRAGEGGLRFVSQDNTKEILAADNHGGVYFNADVFVGGKKIIARDGTVVTKSSSRDRLIYALVCISLLMNMGLIADRLLRK